MSVLRVFADKIHINNDAPAATTLHCNKIYKQQQQQPKTKMVLLTAIDTISINRMYKNTTTKQNIRTLKSIIKGDKRPMKTVHLVFTFPDIWFHIQI